MTTSTEEITYEVRVIDFETFSAWTFERTIEIEIEET